MSCIVVDVYVRCPFMDSHVRGTSGKKGSSFLYILRFGLQQHHSSTRWSGATLDTAQQRYVSIAQDTGYTHSLQLK